MGVEGGGRRTKERVTITTQVRGEREVRRKSGGCEKRSYWRHILKVELIRFPHRLDVEGDRKRREGDSMGFVQSFGEWSCLLKERERNEREWEG